MYSMNSPASHIKFLTGFQALSASLVILILTAFHFETARAATCESAAQSSQLLTPKEAISGETRALQMRWREDQSGRLYQAYAKAPPRRLLNLNEDDTAAFLTGKKSLPLGRVDTYEGSTPTLYMDLLFTTNGSKNIPYPAQAVVQRVRLPMEIGGKDQWYFGQIGTADPGLMWKHQVNGNNEILRADILGNYPDNNKAHYVSFKKTESVSRDSIVYNSRYLRVRFLEREWTLPLFIYKTDSQNRSVIQRPTDVLFELKVSPDGQSLLLTLKVERLFLQHKPIEIVLSEVREEWLPELTGN